MDFICTIRDNPTIFMKALPVNFRFVVCDTKLNLIVDEMAMQT